MFATGVIFKYHICNVYDWGDFQVPWGIGGVGVGYRGGGVGVWGVGI